MNVNKDELQPYIDGDADLISLHTWNKQVVDKKGVVREKGKHPLNRDWTKRPKDTEAAIAKSDKGFNIGYRLNDDDLIIDVDPRNFGDNHDSLADLLAFLGVSDLAEYCPTVLTGGGGFHYYLTKPADYHLRETIEEFPGIEFKTVGRQVVSAGSKHPSGNMYEWDPFAPEYPKRPKCPGRLIKKLKREAPKFQADAGIITEEDLGALLVQIPVEDYKDHSAWFKIMCAAHHGTAGVGIEEFLQWSLADEDYAQDEHNIRYRWDSLSEKNVNITVASLYKDVLSYGGTTAVTSAESEFADFADFADLDEDTEEEDPNGICEMLSEPDLEKSFKPGLASKLAREFNPEDEDEVVRAIRAALQSGSLERVKSLTAIQKKLGMTKGELNGIIKQIKEQIVEDMGRAVAMKVLDAQFHNREGLIFNSDGRFWAYNSKFWEPVTREWVGHEVMRVVDLMRDKIDIRVKESALVGEVTSVLSYVCAKRIDGMRLRKKPYPVVNCQNGELWIKPDGTCKLRPHNPKSRLLQVINVDYEPGLQCPIFDAALLRTFEKFEDKEDIIRHIHELIGYILHPDKRPAHWWLLTGPGGDGKTTLLKIISGLIGDAVQADNLDRYKTGGDKHATAELVGKLLLYDDDLNRNTVLPDGTLKKLSEDGEITANPKGATGFKFVKCCTVAMLCNGWPRTKDMSRGFMRRAMVIPFDKAFHEDGAILDLADQVVQKELAGVLNHAMEGLLRLRTRGAFKEPISCSAAKHSWISESNTVALYKGERVEVTGKVSDWISLGDAYADYSQFCQSYGISHVETKQSFRKTLEDLGVDYGYGAQNVSQFKCVKLRAEVVSDFDGEEDLEWEDF